MALFDFDVLILPIDRDYGIPKTCLLWNTGMRH